MQQITNEKELALINQSIRMLQHARDLVKHFDELHVLMLKRYSLIDETSPQYEEQKEDLLDLCHIYQKGVVNMVETLGEIKRTTDKYKKKYIIVDKEEYGGSLEGVKGVTKVTDYNK